MTCQICSKLNHLAPVCRLRNPTGKVNSLHAHVCYNAQTDTFTSPEPLQEITATLTPAIEGVESVDLSILPDSGANICLGGPSTLDSLGLSESDLLPCERRVEAVGGRRAHSQMR